LIFHFLFFIVFQSNRIKYFLLQKTVVPLFLDHLSCNENVTL
jgi:hypothetical protein